jgi:hypothetical protein
MADGIEFTSRPGKTFVASIKDPADDYAAMATGIACTEVSPGRYRLSTALTGIVWLDAVSGAVRAIGFADLDNPESNGYSNAVDAVISVNTTAIADAVTAAINAEGIELSGSNIAAITLGIYRRLAAGSAAIGQLVGPTQGEPLDAINSADFNYSALIDTASSSRIVFSIRKCADDPTPQLEADSVSGLTILTGQATPTSSQAVITRVSGTQATVLVKAAAFTLLAPGKYHTELRELTNDGRTISKLELPIVIRRSASRRSA